MTVSLRGFPERIMGVEVEYRLDGRSGRWLSDVVRQILLSPDVQTMSVTGRNWHANGGCSYVDTGQLLETNTPEVTSGRQVVAYDRALEAWLIRRTEPVIAGTGLRLGRHNYVGDKEAMLCGFHENYLMAAEAQPQQVAEQLAPFWVTRQVIGGTGLVVPRAEAGPYDWDFHLAQRPWHTRQLVSTSSFQDRGVIRLGREELADRRLYRRFEVIGGDTSILAEPEAAMLDLTALMLLLWENEAGPEVRLLSPRQALHQTAELGLRAPLQLAYGGVTTPLAVQWRYFDAASAFVAAHELEQFEWALAFWEEMLSALELNQWERCQGRLDWVTKWFQLEAASDGHRLDTTAARAVDQSYHALLGDSGEPHRVRAAYDPAWVAPATQAAASTPPPGRAQLRSELIALGQTYGVEPRVYWEVVAFVGKVAGYPDEYRVCLDDPYRLPVESLADTEAYLQARAAQAA